MGKENIRLVSSEISSLWTNYMNDSMSECILRYLLNHITDEEIKSVVQYALDLSLSHQNYLKNLFDNENFAYPNGFGEEDVNVNAPQLYTDIFCINYISQMAKAGMLAYSGMIAMSVREDIRDYFTTVLKETATLYNITTNVMLEKGILIRAPYIAVPTETDYVDSKKYIAGLNPFSEKRPLNTIEISHLFLNTQTNIIGEKIATSYAQTTPTEEIRNFMISGKEISKKHVTIFRTTLTNDEIPDPTTSDEYITDSTTKVFSDKLMMFNMSLLSASGMGNYATAAGASQRLDLIVNYERLSFEIGQYAKSGADIMIKHNLLEQPPPSKVKEGLKKRKDD